MRGTCMAECDIHVILKALSRETTFAFRYKTVYFRRLLRSNYYVGVATNFAEKAFTDDSEPRKFSPSKVFRYTVLYVDIYDRHGPFAKP